MNASKDDSKTFDKYMKIWNDILTGLGLSPVALYYTERGELLSRVSIWRMAIIGLMFILSIFIAILENYRKKFDVFNLGSTLISGYINLTGSFLMTLHTISVLWNSKSYASLISTFLRFNRCSLNARPRTIVVDSLKFTSGYAIVICVCFCFDCYIVSNVDDFTVLRFFLSYVPGLYGLFTICHFACCCFWLREYLWNINRNVEKHSRLFESRTPLPGVEFLKINTVFPECLETQPEVNAKTLRHVRRLYHEVYIMSNSVNTVFGTRNLLTVAHNFGFGTTLIYCGLNEILKYQNNDSSFTILWIVNYFKWSAVCFLLLHGVIWPCNRIYSEAQKTVLLVQQLFTKAAEGELQSELHSFVMQLSHETITFSPHGFFSLNNGLILSIIGSVTSYLIILIQFRITII